MDSQVDYLPLTVGVLYLSQYILIFGVMRTCQVFLEYIYSCSYYPNCKNEKIEFWINGFFLLNAVNFVFTRPYSEGSSKCLSLDQAEAWDGLLMRGFPWAIKKRKAPDTTQRCYFLCARVWVACTLRTMRNASRIRFYNCSGLNFEK